MCYIYNAKDRIHLCLPNCQHDFLKCYEYVYKLHIKTNLLDEEGSLSENAVDQTITELSEGSVQTDGNGNVKSTARENAKTEAKRASARRRTALPGGAVQDGAVLAALTNGKSMRGLSILADAKLSDTVTAIVGSAGGTAAVPVATVDVTGSSAVAHLGDVAGSPTSVGEEGKKTSEM